MPFINRRELRRIARERELATAQQEAESRGEIFTGVRRRVEVNESRPITNIPNFIPNSPEHGDDLFYDSLFRTSITTGLFPYIYHNSNITNNETQQNMPSIEGNTTTFKEYRVSDIVEPLPNVNSMYCNTNSEMRKGVVVRIDPTNPRIIFIRILEHLDHYLENNIEYRVESEYFKLQYRPLSNYRDNDPVRFTRDYRIPTSVIPKGYLDNIRGSSRIGWILENYGIDLMGLPIIPADHYIEEPECSSTNNSEECRPISQYEERNQESEESIINREIIEAKSAIHCFRSSRPPLIVNSDNTLEAFGVKLSKLQVKNLVTIDDHLLGYRGIKTGRFLQRSSHARDVTMSGVYHNGTNTEYKLSSIGFITSKSKDANFINLDAHFGIFNIVKPDNINIGDYITVSDFYLRNMGYNPKCLIRGESINYSYRYGKIVAKVGENFNARVFIRDRESLVVNVLINKNNISKLINPEEAIKLLEKTYSVRIESQDLIKYSGESTDNLTNNKQYKIENITVSGKGSRFDLITIIGDTGKEIRLFRNKFKAVLEIIK